MFINKDIFIDIFQIDETCHFKKPSDICAHLNLYVIGQSEAKKTLSIALTNHQYISYFNKQQKEQIKKQNLMLIGPSGTGKTFIVKTACDYLNISFVSIDITEFSGTGYVGKELEYILESLYVQSGKNIEKTESGIVFIDEIDKISGDTQVNKSDVQQALLKMIEGNVVNITIGKGLGSRQVNIDTSNILFIFAGAFSKLIDIKTKQKNSIGFGQTETQNKDYKITDEDILSVGIATELLGRVGNVVQLKELTENQMLQILTKTKNSPVDQHKRICKYRNLKYTLTTKDYKKIIKEGMKSKLGVRGILKALNKKLEATYYE